MGSSVPRRRHGADLLWTLLEEAGVDKRAAVRITGRDGLAPLIWLCRHGFDDVAYVRSEGGGPHETGDVLLVPHSTEPAELERLLAAHALVREGGVVVIRTPKLRSADGRDPIHRLFETAGYTVERCVDQPSGEIHLARRQPAPRSRVA